MVAPLEPRDGPELVAEHQHVRRRDRERRRDLAQEPRHRVRLVGEAHLDVLDVGRHPRVPEPEVARDPLRELEHPREPAAQAGPTQARLRRHEQLAERALRRIAEAGVGEEIDLAAVHPAAHHLEHEAGERLEAGRDGACHGVEQPILLGGGDPAEEQHRRAAPVEREHLRAAVRAEVDPPPVLGRDPPPDLREEVLEVGPRDDPDAHAEAEEAIELRDGLRGVRRSRHDRGPVPVERHEAEGVVELGREARDVGKGTHGPALHAKTVPGARVRPRRVREGRGRCRATRPLRPVGRYPAAVATDRRTGHEAWLGGALIPDGRVVRCLTVLGHWV